MRRIILCYILTVCVSATAALIDPTPSPTPVTQKSSVADRQAATLKVIKQSVGRGFEALKNAEAGSVLWIFHNPYRLTPQEAEDSLGKDACAGHMLALAAGQILNAASPGSWVGEPCPVTCNPDGTATVSCPAPSPSPSPSVSPSE